MQWVRRIIMLTACLLSLLGKSAWAAAPVRVALVIGNSNYVAAPRLANPAADAKLVAAALHRAGFSDVNLLMDLTKGDFEKALRDFQRKADGAEVALVYYAGHGLEVDGRNWLVPVDATLAEQRDLPFQGIDLDVVLGTVTGAKGLRMVVLDACRDNPFTRSMRRVSGTRGVAERGLADIEVTGTLVLYAQRAGQTALDAAGAGADSPFATAFAARIPEPGVDIRLLISKVRDDVLKATGGRQEPFSYGSLPGVSLELVPGAASSGTTRLDPELQAFNEAATQNSAAGWESYLRAYPAGRYANLARSQRDVINARAAPSPIAPTPSAPSPSAPRQDIAGKQTAAVRDESASRQDEYEADAKMYEAIAIAACLNKDCLDYSAEERQRQTALAQRDCVMAKRQWHSALDKTTSPERAMALKPKIDGDALQCRKMDRCVNTAAAGYAYEYFAPVSGNREMAAGFHCSETDAIPASSQRDIPPTQSATRDESASRQDEFEGDAKMFEAISLAACLKKNCLNYSAEERQRQTALAQRECVMAKKQWRSALQKATSPDRAMALKPKIDGDALQCRKTDRCVNTAAVGYAYEYFAPASGNLEMAAGFHCSESDPI